MRAACPVRRRLVGVIPSRRLLALYPSSLSRSNPDVRSDENIELFEHGRRGQTSIDSDRGRLDSKRVVVGYRQISQRDRHLAVANWAGPVIDANPVQGDRATERCAANNAGRWSASPALVCLRVSCILFHARSTSACVGSFRPGDWRNRTLDRVRRRRRKCRR